MRFGQWAAVGPQAEPAFLEVPAHNEITVMRLILIALCLVAAGFYIKTLFPLQSEGTNAAQPETTDIIYSAAPEDVHTTSSTALRPVPSSQMAIIRDVFAPEMQ